ncbi:alpha-L-fucosidase [Mucilaginibacter yixingensis]|nr:alpha-L-fucosidase [Mucilaginibacter yixingensis]
MKKQLLFALVLFCSAASAQKKYTASWASIDSRPIPAWYTNAKFGIFIHWGVYSVPAYAPVGKEFDVYSKYAEWYWNRLENDTTNVGRAFRHFHEKTYGKNFKYRDFAPMFKAELFNPSQWVDLFVASGAKYVVLTSKHHEGYTLWHSAQSPGWNSVDVGAHRDLAGDLTHAVKAKGLKMGFYYSLYEWNNPLYHSNVHRYVSEHMLPQLKDLVTRYQPDIIWPDGEWEHPAGTWRSAEFLAWLYNDSAVKDDVVTNDRWGSDTRNKHGGYYTTEYDLEGDKNVKNKKITHPWEECRAIGGSFGYNRNENFADYSTPDDLIHVLIEKVAKGGNLLLDIGPAADGTIPVIMQQRLMDIGHWLKINGDAIYNTSVWAGAYASKHPGVFYTRNGKDLYVLCEQYPSVPLKVSGIKKPASIILLSTHGAVSTAYTGKTLTIVPPAFTPKSGRYAWVFKLAGALD